MCFALLLVRKFILIPFNIAHYSSGYKSTDLLIMYNSLRRCGGDSDAEDTRYKKTDAVIHKG